MEKQAICYLTAFGVVLFMGVFSSTPKDGSRRGPGEVVEQGSQVGPLRLRWSSRCWWYAEQGLRNYNTLAGLGAIGRLSYVNHHCQQKLGSELHVQPSVLLVLCVIYRWLVPRRICMGHKKHVACHSSTCHWLKGAHIRCQRSGLLWSQWGDVRCSAEWCEVPSFSSTGWSGGHHNVL